MVPATSADTNPDILPIVATVGLLLTHIPAPASLNVVVSPAQIESGLYTGPGRGLMVTPLIIKQPVDKV